jgi:fatty-acyl-CoA synthase
VIVVKQGYSLDEATVVEYCKSRMAPFKVPKRVVFVESLPKNPSGKLLKRELRARLRG